MWSVSWVTSAHGSDLRVRFQDDFALMLSYHRSFRDVARKVYQNGQRNSSNCVAGNHAALPFYEGASRARQKLVVFANMDDSDCAFVLDSFADAGRYKVKDTTPSPRCQLADFLQMTCD